MKDKWEILLMRIQQFKNAHPMQSHKIDPEATSRLPVQLHYVGLACE